MALTLLDQCCHKGARLHGNIVRKFMFALSYVCVFPRPTHLIVQQAVVPVQIKLSSFEDGHCSRIRERMLAMVHITRFGIQRQLSKEMRDGNRQGGSLLDGRILRRKKKGFLSSLVRQFLEDLGATFPSEEAFLIHIRRSIRSARVSWRFWWLTNTYPLSRDVRCHPDAVAAAAQRRKCGPKFSPVHQFGGANH
jgi:hypothetical protein